MNKREYKINKEEYQIKPSESPFESARLLVQKYKHKVYKVYKQGHIQSYEIIIYNRLP